MNGIYREFAEYFGIDIAEKVFLHFRGLQITFPLKFLSKEYIKIQIFKEYTGSNIRELALKYECSERWVRDVIKGAVKKNRELKMY